MNFHYSDYLTVRLLELQKTLGFSNFNFVVEEEQDFIKRGNYTPRTIYVVLKYLSNNLENGLTTQPVQIMILCEENSLEVSKTIFKQFADNYNWKVVTENNVVVKQQYTHPVVLSNFNEEGFGYRSVMYMSATLYIMENVVDIDPENIIIDGPDADTYTVIAASIAYNMTPNTQQIPSKGNIGTSIKSVSVLALSLQILSTESNFMTKVLQIMNGTNTGNDNFNIKFDLGGQEFDFNYKLTSVKFDSVVNGIPSLMIGFTL